MSHTVTIRTEVRCGESVRAACGRVGAQFLGQGRHELFGDEVEGLGVHLSEWAYPVVFGADGQAAFDNYNGQWGEQKKLDSFLQAYAVERAKLEARKNGHTVIEQAQADGSILLTVQGV